MKRITQSYLLAAVVLTVASISYLVAAPGQTLKVATDTTLCCDAPPCGVPGLPPCTDESPRQ